MTFTPLPILLRSRCLVQHIVGLTFIAWAAFAVVGCSGENSLLGGECANGYAQSGNRCVPTDGGATPTDASDATVPPVDGSVPVDSSADAPADGSDGGGAGGEGGQPTGDASTSDSSIDAGCVPPTPNDCNGTCVDITSDPTNCGACGNVCPSLLCTNSSCVGESASNIVVIGHDYAASSISGISVSQQLILANSVALARGTPIQVWGFEQYADPNAVGIVKQILSSGAKGRTVAYTGVNASQIQSGLMIAQLDLLLIYSQTNSPPGTMATLGTNWQSAIAVFLAQGGVVVVLDGAVANADGGSAEMPAFTSNSNLLQISGHSPVINGASLYVFTPADAIASSVASPYSAVINTAALTVTEVPNVDAGTTIVPVVTNGPTSNATNTIVVHKTQ